MLTRLVVNAAKIGREGTGLSRYSVALIKVLSKVSDIVVISTKSFSSQLNEPCEISHVPDWISITRRVSLLRPLLWLIYSWIFFPLKHCRQISTTHHAVPLVKRQIITVHDIRPFYLPDSPFQWVYFHLFLPRVLKRVDGVLTVTEASKQDLVRAYGVDPSKVFVVSNHVDPRLLTPSKVSPAVFDRPYLLMVGASWAHKNAEEVLHVADIWKSRYDLVVVAGDTAYTRHLKKEVAKRGLKDVVIFRGFVSNGELASLYKGASALIYPSIMEGFGIPPLEAIASGIPVIVSDIPVFREVLSDAAIYVKLGSKESWQRAFRALEDKEVLSTLAVAGKEVLKRYDENRMATELMSALRRIWPDIDLRAMRN